MAGAPRTVSLSAPGPAGELEVLVDEPVAVQPIRHAALVCHPHPLFGGNMTNKVTHILARACNELGAPTVRFNFRGVGQSAGVHDDGRGETDDAVSMLDWTARRWPDANLWLLGFSFGAAMALRASLRRPVARLVTVAPALRWLEQVTTQTPACPWLVVQGDRDEMVDAAAVQAWAKGLAQPPEIKLLAGAEHFFHGRLNDVRDTVLGWLKP
jgi:alpha/beta superfamily hydrolase